jgi:hypothetical protein
MAGMGASDASASQVGMEAGEVVVRFDPGERIGGYNVAVGGGTVTAIDSRTSAFSNGMFINKSVRAGAGCTAPSPQPRPNNTTVVCPLAGARGIRIEYGTAVPDTPPPAGAGASPLNNIGVRAASLPVVIHGSPSAEGAAITTTGAVTVDGGDGDDWYEVNGPTATLAGGAGNDRLAANGTGPALRLDGGPGNDQLIALATGAVLAGGPGDDVFDAEAVTEGRSATAQRIDCGDGADRVNVDGRDTLGPGCAPRVAGLRDGMTLGRFDSAGVLRMATGRLGRTASVRYEVIGPRPPGFSPVGSGNLPVPLRPAGAQDAAPRAWRDPHDGPGDAALRRALRTRRRAINGAFVVMDVRAAGDATIAVVRGALRRAR